ncbi:helix-turn-helix domain-containing protein [Streptomyces sp. NPDC093109]|uniref:helix-turn-helix domain-containing protein n=1 Tax=Streptomyces sp. NPDC093109 TaxID=3154977 RepID=UPI00344F509B
MPVQRGELLARLLLTLEEDTAVVTAPAERAWAEIPTYAAVTREQIEAATFRNRQMAVRVLRTRRPPSMDQTGHAQQATLDRLRAGVPIEDIMAGFRLSVSTIEDRLIELAAELGVPGEEVVPLIRLLSQFSDVLSAAGAAAYREHGLTLAVTERRRRDDWLSALLRGTLDDDQMADGIARFRLDPDAQYIAFCGAAADEATNDRAAATLAAHFHQAPGAHGLLTQVQQGRLMGLLPDLPPAVSGLLIAAGPAARIPQVAVSFETAQRVLAAASGVPEGVRTVDDLGWRIGLRRVPELSTLVRRRYLDPLQAMGPLGNQILDDLGVFLANGRSIPRTARELHVHVNTLRYRLSRFEDATGFSLADTDTIIELAWALEIAARPS